MFFLLILSSCNNEEIFVAEESAIVVEETDESNETESPEEENSNNEDQLPAIDAVDDEGFTKQHVSVDLELYINDLNMPSSVVVTNTNPSNGILTINSNNTTNNPLDDIVIYTPNVGFSGTDSFSYTICDNNNSENCDTATVIITVEPIENDIATNLKAFPSAYGAGSKVTGGRGGQVIHVTNLNDSGPGSFRQAVFTSGPRIIVFDISGEINLQSSIWAEGSNYGNLTIAGETAPEGGITITGDSVNIMVCENIIIRYIRFRNGDGFDGLALRGDGKVIVDHCSFAWAADEALDITSYNIGDVTVQNCHFYNNSMAMMLGSGSDTSGNIGDFSVLKNTFASSSHRFPNFSGNGKIDVINNLSHNYRMRVINFYSQDWNANVIGNYIQAGSNTIGSALSQSFSTTWNKNRLTTGVYKIICNETMSPSLYSKYNYLDPELINVYQNAWDSDSFNHQSPTNNGWTSIDFTGYSETNEFPAWTAFYTEATTQPKAEWFSDTQLPLLGEDPPTILPASALKTDLLPTTGACKTLNADGSINFWRDSLDANSIAEIQNDGSQNYIFASHSGWGINPTYSSVSRPAGYDTDRDGMADIWERSTFGSLDAESNGDHDNDGYTNIEEFITLIDK